MLAAPVVVAYEYTGKWGSSGTGNGQFYRPVAVTVTPDGAYVYAPDTENQRVQYFVDDQQVAVAPASLGRVKALFR